jgi:hypothetical protein
VSASSAAVHRPRDVVIIMDLSGSMRFESLPGVYVDANGTAWPNYPNYARNTSLNPDPAFPQWGHYSATSTAALQGSGSYATSTGVTVDPCNISYASNAGSAIIPDFMSSGSTPAFTAASSSINNTTPGGDDFPKYNNNYVPTLSALLAGATNQAQLLTFSRSATAPSVTGYTANNGSSYGYTQGPNYWGKTFFMWPPDPRGTDLDANNTANHANNGALDWRQRFFFKKNVATGQLGWLDHNNILFNTLGAPMTGFNAVKPVINTPQTQTTVTENGTSVTYTYAINYLAILNWLQSNPSIFPSSMLTGRIQYYSALPDTTDTTLNNRWWTTYPLTDKNERFWKDYIDFVLGLRGTVSAGTYSATNPMASNVPLSALIGNGDYFQWGNTAIAITQKPDNNYKGTVSSAYASGYSGAISVSSVQTFGGNNVVPISGGVGTGDYVRFNSGSTIYRVASVTTNAGICTSITLDQGLNVALNNGDTIRFWSAASNFPYYMSLNDNPYRPRHQLWFGPMTFVDWLGNYQTNQFWWPGNVHEAQSWACKVGIQTAINDMQNNHPNDYIGLSFFSTPMYSANDGGHFNAAVVPMGQNYTQLIDSLWFPPTTVTGSATSITPYDTDMSNVPRANGGTCPGMSFMIAYNMLSSSVTNLRTYAQPEPQYRGSAGGLGRKGADRLVIFETDGSPNVRAVATINNSGSDSYYPIRCVDPANLNDTSNQYPTGGTYANSEVYSVVQQICAQTSASPPGYSTSRKPAYVYCIGYGSLFDPANAGTTQTQALNFLQTVQYNGNTSTDTNGANFPSWQRIYGTTSNRTSGMQTAFTKILQAGIQVSIIQ